MEELAAPELDASPPSRLTAEQAEQLVLRTLGRHADSLLRTARRHSLCADDAHDAYQRGLEIFMRRARTLDPETAGRWLHVVVKHEAMAVRRGRLDLVGAEEIDFDRHESPDVSSPEDRVVDADRIDRAAEALQRLKPQELRAMWLKALGNSYQEISEATGWSHTKVNRCLTEGRKSFLERYAGIEAGEECERWRPVLSAIVDGEATADQLSEARPHLRHCAGCRGTLRGLRDAERSLGAVLPVGLVAAAGAAPGSGGGGLLGRLVETFTGTFHERATASALKVQALLEASSVGKVAAVAASAAVAGGSVAVVGRTDTAAPPARAAAAHTTAPAKPAAATSRVVPRAVIAVPAGARRPSGPTPSPSRRSHKRGTVRPARRAQTRAEFSGAHQSSTGEFSPEAVTPRAPKPPPTPTRSTPPPMNGGEFDP